MYYLDYNQSMNSPEACRRRVLKYVIPVSALAILFNLPKFFEATVKYMPIHSNETHRLIREGVLHPQESDNGSFFIFNENYTGDPGNFSLDEVGIITDWSPGVSTYSAYVWYSVFLWIPPFSLRIS